MKNAEKPVSLTIAGLDPSGGAGVIADVKAMMALGCFPAAVITALTFQNTTGVFGVRKLKAKDVIAQIVPILDDLPVAAVKTGMLPGRAIVSAVAKLITDKKLPPPVVDPVVISTSGHRLISDRAFRALTRELLPFARVVTPNIPEAELLTGLKILSETDMLAAAEAIGAMGAPAVLLKGGHLASVDDAVDLLWEDGTVNYLRAPWIDSTETHGTGCTLSAAIAAGLACNQTLLEAVEGAKKFVHAAIASAPGLGKGNGPVDHGWQFPPSLS